MNYPQRYGPYTLLERLGHGGMSEVDLARQAVADAGYVRLLVIKRLRPDIAAQPHFVRMFQDEARINTELQHANIVQIYSFGSIGKEYYLAMEYIAGTDLRALQKAAIARGGDLPLKVTLRVIADVLAALDYAHRRVDTFGRTMNVVHRDVNPRNIMLSVRGEVKLIDFGVAKADTRPEHTISHSLKGKFAYMSPEQIEGNQPIDGRSDLYAIGLILHELVAGKSPFAGLNDIQTMHRILAGKIPPLDVGGRHPAPERIVALHQQALATNPELRFPDAATMRRSVLQAAEPIGGLATNAELAELVLQLMPDTDRDRLDRLSLYNDTADNLLEPDPTEEFAKTITDIELSASRLNDSPSNTTVNTSSTILQQAQTASRPIFIGLAAGLSILLFVGASIWAADRFLLPSPAQLTAPIPPTPEPEPAPEPEPKTSPQVFEPTTAPVIAPEPLPEPEPEPVRQPPRDTTTPRVLAPEPVPEPAPEQPPEPEPTEFGFIYVTSTPARGLPIYVDGVKVGQTPLRGHRLPVGVHKIETVAPGSEQRQSREVTVAVGRPAQVTFTQE